MDKASEMLVEGRSNKTVKYSNVHAVCSYLLGCQSILAQEPCSSHLSGTVTNVTHLHLMIGVRKLTNTSIQFEAQSGFININNNKHEIEH